MHGQDAHAQLCTVRSSLRLPGLLWCGDARCAAVLPRVPCPRDVVDTDVPLIVICLCGAPSAPGVTRDEDRNCGPGRTEVRERRRESEEKLKLTGATTRVCGNTPRALAEILHRLNLIVVMHAKGTARREFVGRVAYFRRRRVDPLFHADELY